MYFNLNKYFVMGSVNCKHRNPLHVLEQGLQAGITIFQLREKGERALTGDAYVEFAKACQQLCRQYQVPFIINDDVELAIKLDSDGIHVGQADMQLSEFRAICPHKIVGLSVHSLEQFERAIRDGANYVGIGPIFQTKSKQDSIQSSLHFLKVARGAFPNFPIVAIGGINVRNSHLVREIGVDGVAVISEITESINIAETVMAL